MGIQTATFSYFANEELHGTGKEKVQSSTDTCDTRNGYTSAFSVYRGKHGEVRSGNGLSYDVVVSLMKPYNLQGYSLYIDNFYTSPTLVTDL